MYKERNLYVKYFCYFIQITDQLLAIANLLLLFSKLRRVLRYPAAQLYVIL
jgi:hypothetical protein